MAEIVAAALTSHAPPITRRPEVSRRAGRDRLHGGFHELHRRIAAARPDPVATLAPDHSQSLPYSNLPAFRIGVAEARGLRRKPEKPPVWRMP